MRESVRTGDFIQPSENSKFIWESELNLALSGFVLSALSHQFSQSLNPVPVDFLNIHSNEFFWVTCLEWYFSYIFLHLALNSQNEGKSRSH